MTEQFNFEEITPSRIPAMEEFIKKAYEQNPGANQRKKELLELLNQENFNDNLFRKFIDGWNNTQERLKGFKGQYGEIETVNEKHGKLKIYYFRESNSIKFGFSLNS